MSCGITAVAEQQPCFSIIRGFPQVDAKMFAFDNAAGEKFLFASVDRIMRDDMQTYYTASRPRLGAEAVPIRDPQSAHWGTRPSQSIRYARLLAGRGLSGASRCSYEATDPLSERVLYIWKKGRTHVLNPKEVDPNIATAGLTLSNTRSVHSEIDSHEVSRTICPDDSLVVSSNAGICVQQAVPAR